MLRTFVSVPVSAANGAHVDDRNRFRWPSPIGSMLHLHLKFAHWQCRARSMTHPPPPSPTWPPTVPACQRQPAVARWRAPDHRSPTHGRNHLAGLVVGVAAVVVVAVAMVVAVVVVFADDILRPALPPSRRQNERQDGNDHFARWRTSCWRLFLLVTSRVPTPDAPTPPPTGPPLSPPPPLASARQQHHLCAIAFLWRTRAAARCFTACFPKLPLAQAHRGTRARNRYRRRTVAEQIHARYPLTCIHDSTIHRDCTPCNFILCAHFFAYLHATQHSEPAGWQQSLHNWLKHTLETRIY